MIDSIKKSQLFSLVENQPLDYFKLLDELFTPNFSIGQVGISRQEIQFWQAKELIKLEALSGEKREWNKVSFFDFIWLRIVAELRGLGASVETLLLVRNFFYNRLPEDVIEEIIKQCIANPVFDKLKEAVGDDLVKEFYENRYEVKQTLANEFNLLIMIVLGLLDNNYPTYLIVHKDREPELFVMAPSLIDDYKLEDLLLKNSSYYVIYLNSFLVDFFQSPKVKDDDWQRLFKLSKAERKILELLRKEDIKELRVKFNLKQQKGILLVEVVEQTDVNEVQNKLNSLLEKGKFKQIKIQTEGNNLVFVEQTTKYKITVSN
jgi:4-amino-4-deoxy-L-arabinose transferase-like glycosyltransferase